MKKHYFLFLLACICSLGLHASQTDSISVTPSHKYEGPMITKFGIDTRFSWQMLRANGQTDNQHTGFRGEFINLSLNARLYKGLSFAWRQRLNITSERNFWNSTDWMELHYSVNNHWHISAGKQVVAIGGYEYDRAPIDLYITNSEFWHHIACYQFGVSVAYRFNPNHRLLFQFCNSPFRTDIGNNNTYGFSLMWNGKHGIWETIWSVNAFQSTGNRWMSYIALGNKFTFTKNLWLELDYTNRASSGQTFFFKDFTIASEFSAKPHSTIRMFAKYTFDLNDTNSDADVYVAPGTEMHTVSGGIEYEPFKKYPKVLRLFAVAGYNWGVSGNADSALKDGEIRLSAGAKLDLDILEGLRWALKKKKN
ncbi:MAG: hypothetical protein IKU79_02925 [Bacteroidaceae bacterium]|nr:hypothetical protein [Bacteroidaceae bacterium]